MVTAKVHLDDGVKEETTRIAAQLGLTFDEVVNTLLRKFNAEQGFPFEVKLEQRKSAFEMNSAELEAACQNAVRNREVVPMAPYVLLIDQNGNIYKKFRFEEGQGHIVKLENESGNE